MVQKEKGAPIGKRPHREISKVPLIGRARGSGNSKKKISHFLLLVEPFDHFGVTFYCVKKSVKN